jgi:import receptor subunit TOM70
VDQGAEDGEIGTSPQQTDESSDPGLADYMNVLESIQKRNYENVLEKCSHAIQKGLTAALPNALVIHGTFSLLKLETEDAIQDFSQVLGMGDDQVSTKLKVHTLLKRSSAYQVEAKETEANADLARALELDDHDADVFHHRGQLLVAENKLQAAIDDFNKAISLNGSFVHPHIQLGYAQYKLAVMQQSEDMLRKAENTFKRTVKRFPDSGEAHNVYGQMHLDRQNVEKATEMFDKALELSPGNGTTLVHKGLVIIQFKQDMDGGIQMIEEALKVDPKCEFAYETLAAFEIQKGNTERAIELFQKAMSLVRSESELAQAYSLCDAAVIQQKVTRELGIMPPMPMGQQQMFSMM